MSDHDLVKPKRWEGKPLRFKFKFLVANYPEIAISSFLVFVLAPAILTYRYFTYPGSRYEAMGKYKAILRVVRDDDPDVERIMAEKNLGREHFPKC